MGVEAVELRRVRLPLAEPFRTSWGEQRHRDVLLLRALSGDGPDGWGECVAMNEPLYSAEHVDGAHLVIRDHLLPRVAAGLPVDAVRGNPMAKAAVELALLDAELRAAGTSLASHLGAERASVDAGVAVGEASSVEALLASVQRRVAEGYRRVKLKIGPGWDVEPVRAVRERFPSLTLQVDANAAYSLVDADHLAALDELDLLLLEQPLADDDLTGHAALAQRLRTPICLDESITSLRTADQAIALGACEIVNLKSGRVGGLAEAVRIHDRCLAGGVPLWCGGMLETGIGRAANLALAALPGFTLPGDLGASGRWFEHDVVAERIELDADGRLPVPDGPGLGVEVVDLTDVTTSVEVVRLRG